MTSGRDLPAPVPPALVAAVADRYTIDGPLGRGGMATVYLARDLRHHRPVALKLLHPEIAVALGTERFLREIELTAGLAHPHILPLLDSGRAGNVPFYVMPLVAGASLRARLAAEGQLPMDEAFRLTLEVADALAYAHAAGIVHRDIKPENILLQDGHALVADFGIAKAADAAGSPQLTETGMAVGTPAYMSPEQAAGTRRIDGRSDQYGLACVLYEMLAGSPPFLAPNSQALLARHAIDPVPSVRTVRRTVPTAVEHVLVRALAKSPADRFPTMEAFGTALSDAAEGRAQVLEPTRPVRVRRRLRVRWLAGAAAALAAVAVVGSVLRSRGAAGATALPADRVAVLPFDTRCTAGYATWCDGIADLLGVALEGSELRTVEGRAVQNAVRTGGVGPLTTTSGRRVARSLGAGRYVLGSATELGGEFRVSAALYPADGGDAPLAQGSARGTTGHIYRIIDDLTAQLLVGAGGATRISRLASATTDSLDALKAFLAGEEEIRGGRFEQASARLQEAVGRDSGFALGWARLAEVAGYSDNAEVGGLAAGRALALADRLPRRDSIFVAAAYGTDLDHSERLYRALVAADSTDAGAWAALGDLLLHHAPVRARPLSEPRDAFRRAIALGDTSWRNVNHLHWLAGLARDSAAYDSIMQEDLRRFPDGWLAPIYRLELAVLHRDTVAQRSALATLRGGDAGYLWGASHRLAVVAGNLDAAALPAAILTEPSQPLDTRALGHELLAAFAAGRGKWREADAQLASAAAFDPVTALEIRAYLSLAPYLPIGRGSLDSLVLTLSPRAPAGALNGLTPALLERREYLLALVQARLGDPRPAEDVARRLSASVAPGDGALRRGLAAGLRAAAMTARGRPAEALRLLEESWPATVSGSLESPFASRALDRYLRAELLDRIGRPEEALRWYDTAGLQSIFDVVLLGPALYRSGRVFERLGRPEEAARRYGRFVRLWADADEQLQPLVDSARSRVAALRRD